MDTNELQERLRELFEEVLAVAVGQIEPDEICLPDEFENLIRVATFEDLGILSAEPGLVLRFKDGLEAQLTIVRSR